MSCGCKQSVHLPSAVCLGVQLPLQELPLRVAANTELGALGPVLSGAVPGQLCESVPQRGRCGSGNCRTGWRRSLALPRGSWGAALDRGGPCSPGAVLECSALEKGNKQRLVLWGASLGEAIASVWCH